MKISKIWPSQRPRTLMMAAMILLLGLSMPAHSSLMYKGCVGPGNLSATADSSDYKISATLSIGTVTQACEINCYNACNTALSSIGAHGELNQDLITKCIIACQKKTNTSYATNAMRTSSSGSFPLYHTTSATVDINGICTAASLYDSDGYQVVDSGIAVAANDRLIISADYASYVYLCGASTTYLYPHDTTCSNTSLIAPSVVGGPITNTTTNAWGVRSSNWIETGVIARSGDYISIGYVGNYYTSANSAKNRNLAWRAPTDMGTWGSNRVIIIPGDTLANDVTFTRSANLISGASSYTNGLTSYLATNGNNMVISNTVAVGGSSFDITNYTPLCGSSACTDSRAINLPDNGFSEFSGSYFQSNRYINDAGLSSSNAVKFDAVQFAGVLDVNYSNTFSMLGMSHYDIPSGYKNNYSGFIVRIDREGCVYNGGQRLQYAISTANRSSGWTWTDVQLSTILTASEAGEVYLKIKPINSAEINLYKPSCTGQPCSNTKIAAAALLTGNTVDPSGTGGQYTVEVASFPGQLTNTNEIQAGAQISGWDTWLFDQNNGIATLTYQYLTGEKQNNNITLPNIAHTALILYIAITAISFLIGTSKITQKEAIIVLLKCSIISVLISGSSWEFFYSYIFGFIKDGSYQLISNVVLNSGTYIESSGSTSLFDWLMQPVLMLFTPKVWIKIAALMLSGFTGFFIALLILFSIILFMVITFKAIVVCISAMVLMALLSITAPIFICLMLFKYTSPMFFRWLKLYLAFAIQPLMVITMIAVMSKIMIYSFDATLAFTACKSCIVGIPLGNSSWCLIYWPVVLKSMHGSSLSFNSPVSTIQAIFILYISLQAANGLIGHMSDLALELATSAAGAAGGSLSLGINAINGTPFGQIGAAWEMGKGMTGMDPESMKARRGMIDGLTPIPKGKGSDEGSGERRSSPTSDGVAREAYSPPEESSKSKESAPSKAP